MIRCNRHTTMSVCTIGATQRVQEIDVYRVHVLHVSGVCHWRVTDATCSCPGADTSPRSCSRLAPPKPRRRTCGCCCCPLFMTPHHCKCGVNASQPSRSFECLNAVSCQTTGCHTAALCRAPQELPKECGLSVVPERARVQTTMHGSGVAAAARPRIGSNAAQNSTATE
jgi:hypothetical protein